MIEVFDHSCDGVQGRCRVQMRCSAPVSQNATYMLRGRGWIMHLGASADTFIKAGRPESKRIDFSALKMPLFHLLVLMDFSNSFMSSFVPRSRIKAVTERLDLYQVGFRWIKRSIISRWLFKRPEGGQPMTDRVGDCPLNTLQALDYYHRE